MTDIAERNRKIKSVLTAAFGAGKVSVKGSRGTAIVGLLETGS